MNKQKTVSKKVLVLVLKIAGSHKSSENSPSTYFIESDACKCFEPNSVSSNWLKKNTK